MLFKCTGRARVICQLCTRVAAVASRQRGKGYKLARSGGFVCFTQPCKDEINKVIGGREERDAIRRELWCRAASCYKQ